ncbi:potential E3 ubiquitin-protein ligase ariadne-2 [Lutzomyia longipalpis]|uniref:potential E3 ubiquitin-protein ligase ariadne-2 n=1 Tax=Lutzomyia longipalpis TaxID=7200 RepID=UPI002483D5D9|nr:potential E3 ubiquitin-protein ligase ariadne-2 [Lutzomyia longipalpis]
MSGDSDENEMDSYSDNEDDDYYNTGIEDGDVEPFDPHKYDPEFFEYECCTVDEVKKLLNDAVEKLAELLKLSPSLAKILLHENEWCVDGIVSKYRDNPVNLLVSTRINPVNTMVGPYRSSRMCTVCVMYHSVERFFSLSCSDSFCRDCWATHFETQINQGISTAIGCMEPKCNNRVPEDMVLKLLRSSHMREKYLQFAFYDYVKSHPELRFCPGPNCQIIIRSQDLSPKKAFCRMCKSTFCFKCGMEYHAPTDCQVIKKWLTKCADDSETANYISAHTKDCPKCHICIEKNGGCNHMQCFHCKHDFCWMCLGDWKSHGSEYYECSRYKENPNIAHESVHAQAREALKKYLHYYERWENHSKSLQLEQQTLDRLRDRINEKVMKGLGTWIDWQYLFNAAALLAKCRYTLQYTYPYAYYMEAGSRKDLFEYQQANLEAEIENLSWKVERAETTDRGDLENQMDIAEKRRTILLKDFFPTDV